MSKRSINIEIKPKYRDEPFERVMRRFMKKAKKERIVENYRDRMYYEKSSLKRRRLKARRRKVLEKLQIERANKEKKN